MDKYNEAFEKAKAYDEALKLMRDCVPDEDGLVHVRPSDIFRSLEESLDERIRKALLRFHASTIDLDGIKGKDILAWLEKQGRQNPIDKVETKFKVGDWVVWDNKISCHVDNIYQGKESLMYTITDTNNMIRSYSVKSFDNNARLWAIQDTKDGDVLTEDSCIFIIQKLGDNSTAAKTYCTLYNDGDFDDGSILNFDIDSTKPATKEQRDILFQKMHEAGYTFDFEKKELKKIEQNPAWTEADDEELENTINALKGAGKHGSFDWLSTVKWLLTIKQRIGG